MTRTAGPIGSVVGRDAELATLRSRVDAARDGAGSALLLTGEPGVGKTALLDETAASATAAGFATLRCRGVEIEVELPFSALHELLIPLLPEIDDLPDRQRTALETAIGLEDGEPAAPLTVSMAALTLITQAAAKQPVLLIVDDLHWLDEPSALVISFLARRIAHDPVLLLAASRADDVPAAAVIEQLAITGLDSGGARELAERFAERRLHDQTAEAIAGATGGNPLAVIEAVRLLGDAVDRIGTVFDEPLPASALIERSFRARLADLPTEAGAALALLATALTDSAEALVAAAAELGLPADAFAAPERAGVIQRRLGAITFTHPLLRSLAFHLAEPELQRRCHAALAATVPDAALQAWHAASAATQADETVAAAAASAAADLETRGAYLAAARTLEQAARLTPDRQTRAQRLLDAGRAARRTGRGPWTAALLDEAFALAERRSPLQLRVEDERIALVEHTGSNAGLAERQLRLAADAEGVDDELHLDMLVVALGEGMVSGEMEVARQAHARLQRLGPPRDELHAAWMDALVGSFIIASGRNLDEGLALLRSAAAYAVEHPTYSGVALSNILAHLDERELARALIAAGYQHLRSTDDIHTLSLTQWVDAQLRYIEGDWAGADHAAEQSVQLCEVTNLSWQLCNSLALLAMIRGAQGHPSAIHLAERAEEIAQRHSYGNPVLYIQQAFGIAALGRLDGISAVEHLQRAADWAAAAEYREPAMNHWRWDLVEALLLIGQQERAHAALEDLRALSISADRPRVKAAVARLDGMFARDDEIDEHFLFAITTFDELGAPFELGRTHLQYGRRLRRAGRRRAAQEQQLAARAIFSRLGAAPWLQQADAELDAAGGTRPAASSGASSVAQLTAQEKIVADCIAEGMTNKEAAAHLFLTTKTIEWHLRQIYRKLGIRSRVQLAQHVRGSAQETPPVDGRLT